MKDNDILWLLAKGNWIRERTWSLARRDTVGKLSNSEMVFIRGEKVKRYSMLILLYWRAHLFLCVHVFWVFYNRAACQYCYKKDKVTSHDVVYPAIISCDTLLIWITSLRQKLILCKSNFEQVFQPWCQKKCLGHFYIFLIGWLLILKTWNA